MFHVSCSFLVIGFWQSSHSENCQRVAGSINMKMSWSRWWWWWVSIKSIVYFDIYKLKARANFVSSYSNNVGQFCVIFGLTEVLHFIHCCCNDIHCYAFVFVICANVNSCPWHLWRVNVLMQLDPMCDSFDLDLSLRTVLVQLNKYNLSFIFKLTTFTHRYSCNCSYICWT